MYREDKTTQMAARLLQLADGRMPFVKLLRLLYLADKQMLLRWGKPITYDRWIAMSFGPVLSATYDLIKRAEELSYWSSHLRTEGCDVVLQSDPGSDTLSRAEERIIDDVFTEYGRRDEWEIAVKLPPLPEWEEPGNASKEITYQTVLEVEGLPAEVIADILDNIEVQNDIALVSGNG